MAEGCQIDGKHLMHQGTRMETGGKKKQRVVDMELDVVPQPGTFLHTRGGRQ